MNLSTRVSPSNAYQTAIALYSAGRHAEALTTLDRLLHAQAANAEALNLAALCLDNLYREEDAQAGRPPSPESVDVAEAHNNLGIWFFGRNLPLQAECAYRQALTIRPDYAQALNNLGLLLRSLNRRPEAEALFVHALSIRPDYVMARNNLGVLLWEMNRLPEAEAAYRRVVELRPDYVDAHNNLGLLLKEMNRLPEAEAACRYALSLRPDLAEAHNNLGNVLWSLGRMAEAIAAYRQSIAIRPDYAGAKANLALPLLCTGQYDEGWTLYESRYDERIEKRSIVAPPVPYPKWNGEPLEGKSLLVWPEQGLGDSLQFCRYLPMLKARGVERLTIACAPALHRLFEQLEGVDACIALDGSNDVPAHDYWSLLMSLPLHFRTTLDTIPASTPYLRASHALVEQWRRRLPSGAFKVGLVWAGDPRPDQSDSNAIDQRRSLNARAFLPFLKVPGVTFVSLQKGPTTRPQIHDLPPDLRPFDPMDGVKDFADTAAIVESLDLVITVDTSVAHLVGGLGKPVWILSRYDGCWRWMRDRDDSPWYPSARLFRQTRPGVWDDVIHRVTQALAQAAAERD